MRARWLKPEFFTDKKIGRLGMCAALVFEALWCVADDGGTAECEPVLLKGQMFMRWGEITVDAIETALCTLAAAGLIQRYGSGDREFALIKSWKKNQPVHNPSQFRYPRSVQGVTGEEQDTLPQEGGSRTAGLPPSSHPIHPDTQTPRVLDSQIPKTPLPPWSTKANGNGVGGRLQAAELLKDVRILRNPQFPTSLEPLWTTHFSDGYARVIRAVGIERILTTPPANDGPLLAQVAQMLAEVA